MLVHAQRIGVPAAAGQQDGVVVGGPRLVGVAVDLQPACILHQADGQHVGCALRREAQAERRMKFADARRDDMHRGAVLGQPAMGAQDLHLLDAIGAADGDALALEQAGIGRRVERKSLSSRLNSPSAVVSSSVEMDGTGDVDISCCMRWKAVAWGFSSFILLEILNRTLWLKDQNDISLTRLFVTAGSI